MTLNANARSGQGAKIDCSNLTMIQVDIIQMDDYPADSCAISPTALLLQKTFTLQDKHFTELVGSNR